ncbi:MAG: YHS domain-containing protein [Ferruginibacter sp.]
MKIQFIAICTACIFLTQCTAKKNTKEEIKPDVPQPAMQAPPAKDKFKGIQFANTTDYSCGMPVTAGVEDTAQYKGKVYGFCSTECKTDFLQHAETYLTKK